MLPLVSVYITTHNRSSRLYKAVNSVLNQSYKNIEIIISDDGSSDDTELICLKFCQEFDNIRYLRSPVPMGANHARNRALKVSNGEFITGLDDDDQFSLNRIKLFVDSWADKYAFICDNFLNVYGDGSEVAHYKQKKDYVRIQLKELLFENICSNQIFTRKERLLEIYGFDESVRKFQDWDCWIRLAYHFGDGMRLNNKSYLMYHDSEFRISQNQSSNQAFNDLVLRNVKIYSDTLGINFVERYLLLNARPTITDIFKANSLIQCKKILKQLGFIRFIRKYVFYYMKGNITK